MNEPMDNRMDNRMADRAAWRTRWLSEETVTVSTKDLYCTMWHLTGIRAAYLEMMKNGGRVYHIPCDSCMLESKSLECRAGVAARMKNVGRAIGQDVITDGIGLAHLDTEDNCLPNDLRSP